MTYNPSPREAFEVATVRVSKLIYLPSITANEDAYGETFTSDFCDYLPAREDAALYAALPKLKVFVGDEAAFADAPELAEKLWNVPGFLVEAETPAKTFNVGGDGFSYSWGHRYSEWLYAPDEASIATVCAAWADAREAEDRAKTKAA